jgi:hypothetical protein
MSASLTLALLLAVSGALGLRFVRGGEPETGLRVTLESAGVALEGETGADGVARFLGVPPGAYSLKADSLEWELVLSSETEILTLDLDARPIQAIYAGRFGRTTLTRKNLSRLPHAGTVSTVLETLEPFAVTDRIDVAGVESATDPLWSVRGSSWTQNRTLVDGVDVTDPAGGASLLYPDVASFDEISLVTSANPPDVAGPGAELHLVSRAPPSLLEGSLSVRYTGSALQAENLSDELVDLGVAPREVLRFPSARLEMGAAGFYGAIQGFDLTARLPKFDAEEKTGLLGAEGKVAFDRWSLLGIAQRLDRPTYGARPLAESATAVEATETFQVAQASLDARGFLFRLGFVRGELDSTHSGEVSPLRDLATGELFEAPLLVTDRARTRWTAIAVSDFLQSSHLLRGGVELSHTAESGRERVPGSMERLMVDGVGHALSHYSGSGERGASVTRLGLHLQDSFFAGRFRIFPGVRLDLSRSGSIRWSSLSGTVGLGYALTPSSEIHFSLGRYPHMLTTRLPEVEQGLSWTLRRWNDANGDRRVDGGEVGGPLRRGGGGYTSIEDDLPRPYTHELTIGVEKHFRHGFLRFSGYQRWEKRLLQTVNVGIAPESYESFLFHDVGVDGDLGTEDDREIPIYDQRRQLGEDLFRLGQPPGLESFAQGVDLLLGFDYGRVSWQLSGRAYRDVGQGNVGNEPEANDTGVLGDLFDDPNSLTSAEGRLYFDRAFTGKLALTARGPLGIDLGAAIRYWDGQPFTRQIFFEDLGQGFTIVQAYFRGRLRYAFNMTVDVRLERELSLGRSRLALGLDAFNLFNQALQTGENARSGETFREPTFVQPARTVTLSGRLRF